MFVIQEKYLSFKFNFKLRTTLVLLFLSLFFLPQITSFNILQHISWFCSSLLAILIILVLLIMFLIIVAKLVAFTIRIKQNYPVYGADDQEQVLQLSPLFPLLMNAYTFLKNIFTLKSRYLLLISWKMVIFHYIINILRNIVSNNQSLLK